MKLTYEDNERLVEMAQNGDKKALENVTKLNMPLVLNCAKKFFNRGYDAEDLIQAGSYGLVNAIKRFDISYKVRFSTFAVPHIIGDMKRYMRDNNPIHVTREIATMKMTSGYYISKLSKELKREPTLEELAKTMKTNITDLKLALKLTKCNTIESLNGVIYEEEGSQITLADKLKGTFETEDEIIDNLVLEEVIEQLPDELRQIITLKYFEGASQTQIGNMMGLTQVTVSRREKKALKMLRELLEDTKDESIYIEEYKVKINGFMTRDKLRIAL